MSKHKATASSASLKATASVSLRGNQLGPAPGVPRPPQSAPSFNRSPVAGSRHTSSSVWPPTERFSRYGTAHTVPSGSRRSAPAAAKRR